MDTSYSLKSALAELDVPLDPGARSRHGATRQRLEQALAGRLAVCRQDAADLHWIDEMRPQPTGLAWAILERALARASRRYGRGPAQACLAFCPVALIIASSSHELPRFTPDLFRMADPAPIVEALEAHGLADDYAVAVDPQLWPVQQIADLSRSCLPDLAANLADAVLLGHAATLGDHPLLADEGVGIAGSVSVAGGRIIGSFLMAVIYTGDSMVALPQALDFPVSSAQARGFGEAASRALTLALPETPPLRIEAFLGAPQLALSALFEATAAHCEFAAYWGARALVQAGGTAAGITYAHAAEGEGIAVGFDAGPEVEVQVQALAESQAAVNRYALAFSRGAKAAGLPTIAHRVVSSADAGAGEAGHGRVTAH